MIKRTYDRWARLVPERVASDQSYWERGHAILRAVQQCRTRHERAQLVKAVCKKFEIGPARVHQLISKAERQMSRRNGARSPVQKYIETPQLVVGDDVFYLKRAWNRRSSPGMRPVSE